jgi:hypothetical protein
MNDMESIQTRRNTFITGARVKTGKKTTVFRWPHPAHYGANPDTLADAGFYFTPSPDDRDCVRCFACGKELSEWDSDDNPHAIHYQKCGSTCPWAIVRCGLEMERDKRGRYVMLSDQQTMYSIRGSDISLLMQTAYPTANIWRTLDWRPSVTNGHMMM